MILQHSPRTIKLKFQYGAMREQQYHTENLLTETVIATTKFVKIFKDKGKIQKGNLRETKDQPNLFEMLSMI